MSSWKLVEAEAVVEPSAEQRRNDGNHQQRSNDRGNRDRNDRRNGRGNGDRRQGGNRGGGNRRRDDNYSSIFVPDTPESRQAYAAMAVQTM
jgi:hypothetical protein